MELKGKIDDYGIADIFQLIGQQRRSGILTVKSGKNIGEVYFVQGMISRAHPAYSDPRKNPLGECAVKANLVGEKNLEKALVVQEKTLKPLEELFLEMKFLDQYDIQKLADFLLSETLYDVLQWRSGEYDFAMKDVDHDERFYELVSVDHILLDILRMIDEEPELLRRIPNVNIVFEKTAGGGDQDIDFLSSDDDEDEETYEEIVYNFVNGRNRVRTIIDRSLLGRYHTLNALVSLIDAGLIAKTAVGKVEAQKAPVTKNRLVTYLSYSVVPIVLIGFIAAKFITTDFPTYGEVVQAFHPVSLEKTRLPKVKNALEVYYLSYGSYPSSLNELVTSGIVAESDLVTPNGPAFEYRRRSDYVYELK